MSQTVYAYADLNSVQKMVDDGDINYTGTWSSSGTYEAASRDVVLYGSSKFITLTDNVGAVPTARVRRGQAAKWASLVVIRTGTTASVTAAEAYAYAGSALLVAQSGSNTANGAFEAAVVAQDTADLAIQWIGTLASSGVDLVARSTADAAYNIATAGTERLDDRIEAEIQARIHGDGTTYWAGTAYTNAAIAAIPAASAGSELFWAGTNFTNTQVAVEVAARVNGDNSVMGIAVAGTNLATTALAWAGTAVSRSGGTMTGNLHTPMVVLGVGTVPASTAVNGTIFYDFTGPAYQQTTVDRNIVVSAKNITAGAEISAVLISNGTPRQVIYDAQFSWFGTQVPYMSTTANKKILVPLAATGTTATSVLGATTPQL